MASLCGVSLADLVPLARRAEIREMLESVSSKDEGALHTQFVSGDVGTLGVRLDSTALIDSGGERLATVVQLDEEDSEPEEGGGGLELTALRAVVNNLPVILFALDRRGKFVQSEGGGLAALGLRAGQLVGASAFDVYRSVPWILESLEQALAGHQFAGSGAVGDRIYETTYVPVRDRRGRVSGLLGLALDVSERKRVEAERESLINELHAALESRDEFLSVASHELRTPLSALTLKLDLFRRRLDSGGVALTSEELASRADTLIRLGHRLASLVSELLDVSRITTGRLRLEVGDVDLTHLVRDVLERNREQFERAGSTVTLEADPDVRGRWDATRLEQVIENLLSNARVHGGGGGVEVHVKAEGERATFSVRDHGPGIAPEEQLRIFERFVRVAPRGSGGLGLGLYITRQIVEAHGGTIHVESELGHGATFTVSLPRHSPEVTT